ncbi:MAG TPA: hypothetical protein PL045_05180 [Chitinophagaceae bacterium]|nr:hypothetical protein [Chitinophagaceae bacterium]
MQKYLQFPAFKVVWLSLVFSVAACTEVRLVSNYDEVADKTITAMQEKFSKEFVVLQRNAGTDAGSYQKNTAFYDDIYADLNMLSIRANAMDKNEIIKQQIELFTANIKNMEALHKIGFRTAEAVEPLKLLLNMDLANISKFLSALKRGQTPTQ